MKFTEARLEQAFTGLMEEEGYTHSLGTTLPRQFEDVLIKDDLITFLCNQYQHEDLTRTEAQQIVLKLESYPATDLYESNKAISKLIADGFVLKREDHTKKDLYIQLLDYSGLNAFKTPDPIKLDVIVAEDETTYQKDNNIYRFVTQMEIVSYHKRIPDGILYVNGLPLVVFEFKTAIKENCTIHDAYKQ